MSVAFIKSSLLQEIDSIQHSFFGNLNVNSHIGDPAIAEANRLLICQSLNIQREQLMMLNQTHSKIVHRADHLSFNQILEGDAWVATQKGVFIGIQTADCVPILLASTAQRMVAAVHAGWKGAVQGIIFETFKMLQNLGTNPQEIIAAMGPCIWQESYEVGTDVYDAVQDQRFFKIASKPNHWLFDLPGYVTSQLYEAGVLRVSPSPSNTYVEADQYFSYRRNRHQSKASEGGQLSVIGIT